MNERTDDELVRELMDECGRIDIEPADRTAAKIAVLRRFSQLRDLLTGRTMHCGMCDWTAKQAAERAHEADALLEAINDFVRLNKGQHGNKWLKALDRLEAIATGVKP